MAIDQRDVSSTLRFMDDRALQRYAAMHKSDPYIFPLAFQESQNRQKMRMSQQSAQGMQPQPKVADQALAQMAPQQPRPMAQPMPEEMGIGALPAGNMEGMADGGIVGYEGYDESGVPNTFGEGPVRMMAEGGVARYQVGGVLGDIPGYVPGATPFMPQAGAPEELPFFQRQLAAAREKGMQYQLSQAQARIAQGVGTAPDFALIAEAQRKADAGAPPTRRSDYETAAPAPAVDAAPKVDTGRKDTSRKDTERKAPAAVAAPASAGLAGLKDPAKLYQDILAKQDYKDPAADALLELEARERANAAADRQAIVSDAERFKDAFKGREGRLAEREADIGKQKESNTGLALLNAGLAIMSTPGGLATAIGKGAQVGTAQFAAGLDKIRSAQERLTEARDRLDDLKLNREESTAKEIRAAERNYRDVATNAQKRTIDGIRAAAGVTEKRAESIYNKTLDVQKTMYEQGEENKRNAARVAASGRNNQLELLQAVNADPKLMAAYRAMQGKNEDVMGQYNDFLKANPTLAMDPKAAFTQFLMTKSAFQQLGTPTVTDKPTGPVRN
jgi:hypothetical protein